MGKIKDDLGKRVKFFEELQVMDRFFVGLPVLARIDGRAFSKFTKGLRRPYDERLSALMIDTARFLMHESACDISFTSSDEISLAWKGDYVFFEGRVQKMMSNLASLATAYFNRELPLRIPEKANSLATFDCRVWQVPNFEELRSALVWRQIDARRNAVSMAARAYFSHKELLNKSSAEMVQMMYDNEIEFRDFPNFFRNGTALIKNKQERAYSTDELDKLPAKHAARTNPSLTVIRSVIRPFEDHLKNLKEEDLV